MAVRQAVYFKSDIAPGLHNLSGLRERAVIAPLADGVPNNVDNLGIL